MKEEAQLTFKPSVNQYHDVRAQLSLRHPEAYLARLDAKRQAQLAQRLEERRTREVGLPALLLLTGYRITIDVLLPPCFDISISVSISVSRSQPTFLERRQKERQRQRSPEPSTKTVWTRHKHR